MLFDWVGVGGYHQICYIMVTKGGIRGVFQAVKCYKGWY